MRFRLGIEKSPRGLTRFRLEIEKSPRGLTVLLRFPQGQTISHILDIVKSYGCAGKI